MLTPSYNQTLLAMAREARAALAAAHAGSANAARQSHFLCNWMAQALKDKRYHKCIAAELTAWVRQGRSLGAAACLVTLLERIVNQYSALAGQHRGLGKAIRLLLDDAIAKGFIVYTDTPITTKLKLDADGQASIIICTTEYSGHIQGDELLRPLTLYARCDEDLLASMAFEHGLMLTEGDKKGSLIKHHKAYRIFPGNELPSLALLKQH